MNNTKKLCHYCHKTVPTCLLTVDSSQQLECSFCVLQRLERELQVKKQNLLLHNFEQVNHIEQS